MARLQKVPEIRIETPDSPGQEEGDLSGAKLLEDESSPTVAAAHNSNSRHSHQAVKFKDEELIALQPPPVQFSHGANHHHHLGNSKSFNDSNSLFLEIPEDGNTHSKLHLPRQSIISRQSIEMFLDKFPHNETEYANQEIMGAVREIINADMGLSKEMSTLEKMRVIISSHRFHLFYIGLVVLDCICVISQMILDVFSTRLEQRHADNNSIKPLSSSSSHHHGDSPLEHLEIIAECVSVSILSVFFILILCHVALLGKIYYRSKLEMFDAIIVISSLILEIVSIVQKYVREVKVAVITFRFWRIIRIVNAIVITVEKRVYRKLDNLKSDIRYIIDENLKMEEELVKKGDEIRELTSELDEKTKKINEMSKQLLEYQTENKRQMLKSNSVINSLREDLKSRDEENVHLKNRFSKKSPKDEETS